MNLFRSRRAFTDFKLFPSIAWGTVTVLLFCHLHEVFTGQPIAGWDLTPHRYLYFKFLENLRAGQFTAYDVNWFGGYPLFVLYPPLAYLICAIPYLISFGLIPADLSFNIMLFGTPLILLWAMRTAARTAFGAGYDVCALLFGTLFLMADREVSHLGVGLSAEIFVGLYPNFIGLAVFLFFWSQYQLAITSKTIRHSFFATIFLALLVLTHVLTAIFAAWAICSAVIWLVVNRASRSRVTTAVLIPACAALVTSWWWIPFLRNLPYSSGEPLGLNSVYPDPLFALFPGLNPGRLGHLWNEFGAWREVPLASFGSVSLPVFLLDFPFAGISIFVCLCIGLYRLIGQRNSLLPILFLSSFICLPRDFFSQTISLALHYYRFIQPVMVVALLIAAFGLGELWRSAHDHRYRRSAIAAWFTLTLIVATLFNTSLTQPFIEPFGDGREGDFDYSLRQDAYERYPQAVEMMEFISQLHPSGRVAIESPVKTMILLGSPHFFSTFLPLRYGVPVLPGLLAESALSAGFQIPLLRAYSDNLVWGRTALSRSEDFNKQSLDTMVSRFELFHVSHLLTVTRYYSQALERQAPALKLVKRIGEFALYELPAPRPKIECTTHRPMLFVDGGGLTFRELAEEWFKLPKLFDYPIIFSPKRYQELPERDRSQIRGVIISLPKLSVAAAREKLMPWREIKKPLIVLNLKLEAATQLQNEFPDGLTAIPGFGTPSRQEKLEQAILGHADIVPQRTEIFPRVMNGEQIEFEASCGAIINYSFAPGWHAQNGEVYWSTPSVMFTFSNGVTSLQFF